jgi:hypothetical protein
MSVSSVTVPISLSSVNLETGAPAFGTADLTELRYVPRPFPKDAAERECYRYLLERMQAAPDGPCVTKANLEKTCRDLFHVTVQSFEYCWREGIRATGARWHEPGRRPR